MRNTIHSIITFAAFLIFMIGAGFADSESLALTVILCSVGVLVMLEEGAYWRKHLERY